MRLNELCPSRQRDRRLHPVYLQLGQFHDFHQENEQSSCSEYICSFTSGWEQRSLNVLIGHRAETGTDRNQTSSCIWGLNAMEMSACCKLAVSNFSSLITIAWHGFMYFDKRHLFLQCACNPSPRSFPVCTQSNESLHKLITVSISGLACLFQASVGILWSNCLLLLVKHLPVYTGRF